MLREKRRSSSLSTENGINEFVSRVAAAVALPGGGSVAAFAGVFAAALGEMMAGLTEGRAQYAPVESRVLEIHAKLTGCRESLRELVEDDSSAYQSLLEAKKLPRNTEEEKVVRNEAIEKSTRAATETPMRTARAAFAVLEYLALLIEIGNPHARSDVATGAQLAYASLKSSQYNVLSNIPGLRDTSFADSCRREVFDLVRRGRNSLQFIEEMLINC
jgi:formiminotetrahydrofolate cyclodeaminase